MEHICFAELDEVNGYQVWNSSSCKAKGKGQKRQEGGQRGEKRGGEGKD